MEACNKMGEGQRQRQIRPGGQGARSVALAQPNPISLPAFESPKQDFSDLHRLFGKGRSK